MMFCLLIIKGRTLTVAFLRAALKLANQIDSPLLFIVTLHLTNERKFIPLTINKKRL